jgi:hypothetical protein
MGHSAPQVRVPIQIQSPARTDYGKQLKDQSLFIEKAYINGEWVGAQSGKTFEVHGRIHATRHFSYAGC